MQGYKMSVSDSKLSLKYFTNTGECNDELKLIFDDEECLYVSENFLCYASPVFKAMFEHEFMEKTTREVKLPGKNYEHFLEFLLSLHPAVQKTIDNNNVLDVAALADEYQVELTVSRCKTVMKTWLTSEYDYIRQQSITDQDLRKHVATCLRILHKCLQCKFTDVTEKAFETVSKFGYGVFSGRLKMVNQSNINNYRTLSGITHANYITEDDDPADFECHRLFSDLPEHIKWNLLTERLILCDKNTTL